MKYPKDTDLIGMNRDKFLDDITDSLADTVNEIKNDILKSNQPLALKKVKIELTKLIASFFAVQAEKRIFQDIPPEKGLIIGKLTFGGEILETARTLTQVKPLRDALEECPRQERICQVIAYKMAIEYIKKYGFEE